MFTVARSGYAAVANAVWSAVALGSRTVTASTVTDKTGYSGTVTDKTGFSLVAGSYSVRASSAQRGTMTITAGNQTDTATISAVTVTRSHLSWLGTTYTNATSTWSSDFASRISTVTGTEIRAHRGPITTLGANSLINGFEVIELL